MHKIISLKKEITFQNTIEEIISISMDNKLFLDDLLIKGNFFIDGEYLNLSKREPFHFEIPYLSYLEEIYDTSDAVVKVDDFYYEIIEPNKLLLAIDILVDNLSEKIFSEDINVRTNKEREKIVDALVEDVKNEEDKTEELKINMQRNLEEINLEDRFSEKDIMIFKDDYKEAYMTYKVYIVRDGDTIETILSKYGISLDLLNKYNVINEINVGDKLIIPNEKDK